MIGTKKISKQLKRSKLEKKMIKPEERNSGNEDLLVYCKNFPLLLLLFDILLLMFVS